MKKVLTAAITAFMLISLISVFQAGTASANGDSVPNPTFATVHDYATPSTEISIGWERNPSIDNSHLSGTDAIHVTTSTATLDYAMVIVPTNFTLEDNTEISYWGYTVSGNVKAPDEIYLFLDTDSDGTVDNLLTSHKPGPEASAWYGQWNEWNSTDTFRTEENMTGINEWHDATLGGNYEALVDPTAYSGATVLAIALTAGPSTAGEQVNVDVYFDELTVDGGVVLDDDTGTIEVPESLPQFPALSIQDAIDAALPGDIIKAAAGTYNEAIVIDKQLTLRGANADVNPVTETRGAESIIDAQGADRAVNILGELGVVTFEGFTVRNFANQGICHRFDERLGTTVHVLNNIVVALVP